MQSLRECHVGCGRDVDRKSCKRDIVFVFSHLQNLFWPWAICVEQVNHHIRNTLANPAKYKARTRIDCSGVGLPIILVCPNRVYLQGKNHCWQGYCTSPQWLCRIKKCIVMRTWQTLWKYVVSDSTRQETQPSSRHDHQHIPHTAIEISLRWCYRRTCS